MNSREKSLPTYRTINDLAAALCDASLDFNEIIRSIDLPISDLEEYCSWSKESYTRNCIIDCQSFELILLCWENGQMTPIHDHGGEECWVRVVQGNFEETIYQTNESGELNKVRSTLSKAGDISYMKDFMGFHRLHNLDDSRSMSLHLYAKPIRNCQLYDEELEEFVETDLVYDTVSEDATLINL